jgi:hypothetical protein
MNQELTQDYLKSIMSYDPETGVMIWVSVKRKMFIGKPVGAKMGDGYLSTRVLGKSYLLHRLAWFYMHGYFPKSIDHINGIRTDNRLCNLRVASNDENVMNQPLKSNNTSGFKGVSWHSIMGKWLAYITYKGVRMRLGYFSDINEAARVVTEARTRLHGEFANHGQFKQV